VGHLEGDHRRPQCPRRRSARLQLHLGLQRDRRGPRKRKSNSGRRYLELLLDCFLRPSL